MSLVHDFDCSLVRVHVVISAEYKLQTALSSAYMNILLIHSKMSHELKQLFVVLYRALCGQ